MKLKTWVVGRTDLPDDVVETDDEIIHQPGRNIAEAMQEILGRIGCTKVGEPWEEGEQGWQFLFESEAKPFWCQASRAEGDDCMVVVGKNYMSEGLFRRGPSRHEQLLQRLGVAMAEDGRFHDLRWYTQDEIDSGNWQAPSERTAG
jgi:hypothetical protein